ncbi:MAG: Flp pilus assembly complex ATPase component TadA, partial [Lentisphaerae bacterium]|nr:Flp pilus assembly complex ATPase component TadA [Lentisphaerota bacterium]
MSLLKDLLAKAVDDGASDVHVKPHEEPYFRISGELTKSGFAAPSPDDMRGFIKDLLPAYLQQHFESDHEADFSHVEEDVGRFRVNVFLSQGVPVIAMRHVKSAVPTFEDLRIPPQLRAMAHVERGIILLSGTTGSGKSTTLAAIIGEINRTQRRRIITIEDPIDYVIEDELSVITQREVGLDTLSFENALKHVLRQDPDVI